MKGRYRQAKGFTLLELLMVIIIIAILASVALPQYMRMSVKASRSQAISLLAQIATAEKLYAQERGVYTTAIANLPIQFDPLLFGPTPPTGNWQFGFVGVDAAVPVTGTAWVITATAVSGPAFGPGGACIVGYNVEAGAVVPGGTPPSTLGDDGNTVAC